MKSLSTSTMYQPDAYIPYPNHYPNHYPQSVSTIPTPLSYFPFQQHLQVKAEPVPPEPPEPVVTPKVASKAIQRLILLELQHAGFESAEKSAVNRLELEVSTCTSLELFELDFELIDSFSHPTVISTGTRICKSRESCSIHRF